MRLESTIGSLAAVTAGAWRSALQQHDWRRYYCASFAVGGGHLSICDDHAGFGGVLPLVPVRRLELML
jgi:hypothetical protein